MRGRWRSFAQTWSERRKEVGLLFQPGATARARLEVAAAATAVEVRVVRDGVRVEDEHLVILVVDADERCPGSLAVAL